MVSSNAKTVDDYLRSLPEERRDAIAKVRAVMRENLPRGFEEGMQYGMIGYYVPLSRFPNTYNGHPLAIAGLASQKQYMSLYLMSVYAHAETRRWFEDAYREAGKKLDMGKSCVRFKNLEDLPLEVIGEAIARVGVDMFIREYEKVHSSTAAAKRAAARKKPPAKKKKATTTKARASTARSRPRASRRSASSTARRR